MTNQLRTTIHMAQGLSREEKRELMEILSRDLREGAAIEQAAQQFWTPQSLDKIAAAQHVSEVNDVHALAVDFWPDDESADDINAYVAARRRADRCGSA